MSRIVAAVYRRGTLILQQPLSLPESSAVVLEVLVPSPADEAYHRMEEPSLLITDHLFVPPSHRPPLEW